MSIKYTVQFVTTFNGVLTTFTEYVFAKTMSDSLYAALDNASTRLARETLRLKPSILDELRDNLTDWDTILGWRSCTADNVIHKRRSA